MRLARCLMLATAFASLAFAAEAAAQSGYGSRPSALPRDASPRAMDPSWAFAFDPLMSAPGWTMDYGANVSNGALERGAAGLGGPTDAEVQRMMAEMNLDFADASFASANGDSGLAPLRRMVPFGSTVAALPGGCPPVNVAGVRYYSCDGNWYRPQAGQFVAVAPPQ